MRKLFSAILTVALTVTGVLGNGLPIMNPTVYAYEMPQTMKVPIVLYDHLNDNLLFEYVLGSKLSLFDDNDTSGNAGKGLVETELGTEGTPVYKKETVIQVAKDVKEYLETQGFAEPTDLYKRLRSQMVEEATSKNIIGNNRRSLVERGWDFGDLTYKTQDDKDFWYSGDELVWTREGDQLIAKVKDATATFTFKDLEAGKYEFVPFQGLTKDVEMNIVTEEGTYSVSDKCDFTLTKKQSVKLTVKAQEADAALVNPKLYKDNVIIDKYDNITMPKANKFTDDGWVVEPGSTWKDANGAITCDAGENTKTYLEYAVKQGRTYSISDIQNPNNVYKLSVTKDDGTVIAEDLKFQDEFKIPEGVNKVRIVLESRKTDATQNTLNFWFLAIDCKSYAILGSEDNDDASYEASKVKFTRVEGQKAATSKDIKNCMDYAYYMLNSFWTDTNGDITQKTNAYKSLQLDLYNGKYTYTNNNTVYDVENKLIYKDEANAPIGEGFFPLDDTVLGDKSDLKAPFGKDDEVSGHNFHYAMKAHCEFVYSSEKNLLFDFKGDDDVYLFINGKLAMDIGGAHSSLDGHVDLNDPDVKAKLGLEEGETYTFDFFYMERHTTESNISIETNMYLDQASAKPSLKFVDKDGKEITDGSKVTIGEEVGLEYGVEAGSNSMQDATFEDKTLGVKIGKDGIDLGNKGAYIKDKLVVEVLDKDGKVKETHEISAKDLEDPAKKAAFADEIGRITLNRKEKIVVKGVTKKVGYDEVFSSELDVSIFAPEKGYSDDGKVTTTLGEAPVSAVEGTIIPKATVDAEMSVAFKNATTGKTLSEETPVTQGTKVGVEYTITAKSAYMKNLALEDKLGGNNAFKLSSNGIELGDKLNVSNDGIVVTVTDSNGTVKETYKLSKADYEAKNAKYDEFLKKFGDGNDAIIMDNGDKLTISGLEHTIKADGLVANPTGTLTGPNPQYNEETGKINVVYDKADLSANGQIKAIPKVGVTFVVDNKKGTTNDQLTYTVDENTSTGNEPTVTNKPGYTFTGWKMTVNGVEKDFTGNPKDVLITDDTVFTAQFTTNKYKYTVKYVDEDGNTIPGHDAVLRGEHDYDSEVSEDAIDIEGYHLVAGQQKNKTLTITEDENKNVIEFVYEINKYDVRFNVEKDSEGKQHGTINDAKTEITDKVKHGSSITDVPVVKADKGYEFIGWVSEDNPDKILTEEEIKSLVIKGDVGFIAKFQPKTYSYTVKYIDKDTNQEIAPVKTENAKFDAKVTEEAVDIPFYAVDGSLTQTITMKEDGNEIIFVYEKNKHNVIFEADENGTVTGDTTQSVKHDEKVSSVPTPTPDRGYEFLGWEKTVASGTVASDNPGEEQITEKTTFTAKFGPLKYDYVVKYVDEDGKELLAEKRVADVAFGTKITEKAENIYGYEPDADDKDIVIDVSDENNTNEITFVYKKKAFNVSFTTDGNGTLEGKTEESVKYNDSITAVPKNSAKTGYKFTGWTMKTSDGKDVPVDDPAKVKITDNTVFTAHYEKQTYDYKVKYVDEKGKEISPSVTKSAKYGDTVEEIVKAISGYKSKTSKKSITIKVEGNEIVFVYSKSKVVKHNSKVKDESEKNTKKSKAKTKTGNVKAATDKSNNGNVSTTSGNTAKNTATTSAPQTGESNNIFAYLFAFLFSGVALLIMNVRRKRKKFEC